MKYGKHNPYPVGLAGLLNGNTPTHRRETKAERERQATCTCDHERQIECGHCIAGHARWLAENGSDW
jgi:hypothetical protein